MLNLTVDDIFGGLGGWSIGFHREGFVCHGVDIVDVGYPYDLTVCDVRDYHPNYRPDVIVESPPCTEFSQLTILSWKKGQRGPPEPEKGIALVKEGFRVIQEAQPTFWIVENVYGSIKHISPILGKPRLLAKPWVLWGNFPEFMFETEPRRSTRKSLGVHFGKGGDVLGKGGGRIGLPEDFPFDPLRSWKRARIPVFLSQRIAQVCKEALLEKEVSQ